MNRIMAMLPPLRWWRSLRALMGRSRVHPQALIFGRFHQVILGNGCVLGARVRVDPRSNGCVIFGARVWLATDVEIETDSRVILGEGTTVQRRSTINGTTRIGSECILAPNVFISSGTHPFRSIPYLNIREQERLIGDVINAADEFDRPVWVQDDCWLGANAVVLPGVTVGKGCVVGANAVVTKDTPPYSVVAGVPARVVATRLDWQPPMTINPNCKEDAPYLLDARIGGDINYRCIEVFKDRPMLAALQVPNYGGQLEVSCRATKPISIVLRHRFIKLPQGDGVLVLNFDDLYIKYGAAHCCLMLSPDSDSEDKLEITLLKVINP